jgi:hypothetical protein
MPQHFDQLLAVSCLILVVIDMYIAFLCFRRETRRSSLWISLPILNRLVTTDNIRKMVNAIVKSPVLFSNLCPDP